MHLRGFACILYISSLGLDNVGLERGNVVLIQPTREGGQAARHCQTEGLEAEPFEANKAHLGTLHYSRTQFSHEASHPELPGRVLGRATVSSSS